MFESQGVYSVKVEVITTHNTVLEKSITVVSTFINIKRGECHKNASFKIFFIVMPKESLAGGAPPILLLV